MFVFYGLFGMIAVLMVTLWIQGFRAKRNGQRLRSAADMCADFRQERMWQHVRTSYTGSRTMGSGDAYYPHRDRTLKRRSEAQRVRQARPDRIPDHIDDDR